MTSTGTISFSRRMLLHELADNCLSNCSHYLKHWPCTQYCLLHSTAMSSFLAKSSKMVQEKAGALCLATPTLTTDYYALISSFLQHIMIRCIRNSKNVWRKFWAQPSILVQFHILRIVNWMKLEYKTNIFQYRQSKIMNILSAMNFSKQVSSKVERPKVAANITFLWTLYYKHVY